MEDGAGGAATGTIFHATLLTLTEGVGNFAIEIIQVLGLDKVEPGLSDTLQQGDDLGVVDRFTFCGGHETNTPVIGAEGLSHALRPDFSAAIGDHSQIESAAIGLLQCCPK